MDEVSKVFGLPSVGNKFQITDALANRDPQRVGIDDTSEPLTRMLSSSGFYQEIIVKGENRPTEACGPLQELWVRKGLRSIFLSG